MAAPAQAQALLTQFNALSEATLSTYYTDSFLFQLWLSFFFTVIFFFYHLQFATVLIGFDIFFLVAFAFFCLYGFFTVNYYYY